MPRNQRGGGDGPADQSFFFTGRTPLLEKMKSIVAEASSAGPAAAAAAAAAAPSPPPPPKSSAASSSNTSGDDTTTNCDRDDTDYNNSRGLLTDKEEEGNDGGGEQGEQKGGSGGGDSKDGKNRNGEGSKAEERGNRAKGEGERNGVSMWLWQGPKGCGKTSLLRQFLSNLDSPMHRFTMASRQDGDEDESAKAAAPPQPVDGDTTAAAAIVKAHASFPDREFIQGPQREDALAPVLQSIDDVVRDTPAVGPDLLLEVLSPHDLSALLPLLSHLREKLEGRVEQSSPSGSRNGARVNIQHLAVALGRLLDVVTSPPPRAAAAATAAAAAAAEEGSNSNGGGSGSDRCSRTFVWCIDDLHLASPAALALLERLLMKRPAAAAAGGGGGGETSSPRRWVVFATSNEIDTSARVAAPSPNNSKTFLGPFLIKLKQQGIQELRIREIPPLSVKNIARIVAHQLKIPAPVAGDAVPVSNASAAKLRGLAKIVLQQTKGRALTAVWQIRLLQDLRLLPKQAKAKVVKNDDAVVDTDSNEMQQMVEYKLDWDEQAIENLPVMKLPDNESANSAEELLHKLITIRWRAMPPKIQSILQVAACYHGQVFGAEALYGLLREPLDGSSSSSGGKRKQTSMLPQVETPDELYGWLAYATQLGFLAVPPRGVQLFGFAHDAIRHVIYKASPYAKLHLELGRRCYHPLAAGLSSSSPTNSETGTTTKDFMLMYGTVQHWSRASALLSPEERLELARLEQRVARYFLRSNQQQQQQSWFAAGAIAHLAMESYGCKFGAPPQQQAESWTAHFDELLDCLTTLLHAEYACGRLDACRKFGKVVLQQCGRFSNNPAPVTSLVSGSPFANPYATPAVCSAKRDVYHTQLSSLVQQHRSKEALGLAVTVLKELGEDIPNFGSSSVGKYLIERVIPETQALLLNFNFEDITRASQCQRRGSGRGVQVPNQSDFATSGNDIISDRMEFWERLVDIAQLPSPNYQALALLRTLQLTVEYGRCFPLSGLAFIFYGFVLGQVKGMYAEARQYANMGMGLLSNSAESNTAVYAARAKIMFSEIPMFASQFVNLQELCRSNDTLCRYGHLDSACMGRITSFWTYFGSEATLSRVEEMRRFLWLLQDYGRDHLTCLYAPVVRLVERLTGSQFEALESQDDEDEKRTIEKLLVIAQRDPSTASPTSMTPAMIEECVRSIAICRMVRSYLYGDLIEAGEMLDRILLLESQSQQHRRFSTCVLSSAQLFLLGMVVWSLSDAAQNHSSVEDSAKETVRRYQQGEAILRKLEDRAKRGGCGGAAMSHGCRHMILLLRAQEQCSRPTSVNLSSTANAYDSAIAAASSAGSGPNRNKTSSSSKAESTAPFFSALGCERAADFFKGQGEIRTAATHYKRAMMGYQKFGAQSKVNDIQGKHQALLWLMDKKDNDDGAEEE